MADFSGTGPGAQAADGCSVEFYRQLPYQGELDEILPLLPPHSRVLELGCGTGRLAGHLASLGHEVTGVDNSPDMLRHLPNGVVGVLGDIESLELGERFPVVLLPSHLINHPDASVREAFIACARRHLANDGRFYLKRHDTHWLASVTRGLVAENGDVRYSAESVERDGGQVRMTLVYEAFGSLWTQTFSAQPMSEKDVTLLLAAHELTTRWHGARRLWAEAQNNARLIARE